MFSVCDLQVLCNKLLVLISSATVSHLSILHYLGSPFSYKYAFVLIICLVFTQMKLPIKETYLANLERNMNSCIYDELCNYSFFFILQICTVVSCWVEELICGTLSSLQLRIQVYYNSFVYLSWNRNQTFWRYTNTLESTVEKVQWPFYK